jgi:hypothetical protein
MANLKSLKLSSFWKGPVAQEIHRAVDMSSVSSLRELTVHEKEVLHMLSSYIPNNPTLRVLDHSTENSVAGYRLSLSLCVNFFNAVVSSLITNNTVMASFSGQTLKILEIKHCSNITLVGWQSLATALASLDNLEDVSIQFHLVNNEDDALLDSNSSMFLLNTFIAEPFIQ